MRSKASIKSHPLHPILICFPLAFFIGSFLFDVFFLFSQKYSYQTTAYYLNLAGIVGAVLAAVPGFMDFLYTVPPDSSAKKRAAKHGLLNTGNLLLFVAVVLLKRNASLDYRILVAMEAIGVVVLFVAGWLGGTLVYRNQIGVDPRYAEAGKWKEEYVDANEDAVRVAGTDELKTNQMKLIHTGGKRIVIARSEKGYTAFSDRCTHKGGSLAGGALICGTVQCPWHGSQFDVYDGTVMAGPAKKPIETFTVEERDGAVFLHLSKTKK